MFKVLCRNLCIACLHPLTRRYGSHDIQRLAVERELWDSNFGNV
nr:hypothetical protein [Vibrio parahaemolyticus]